MQLVQRVKRVNVEAQGALGQLVKKDKKEPGVQLDLLVAQGHMVQRENQVLLGKMG